MLILKRNHRTGYMRKIKIPTLMGPFEINYRDEDVPDKTNFDIITIFRNYICLVNDLDFLVFNDMIYFKYDVFIYKKKITPLNVGKYYPMDIIIRIYYPSGEHDFYFTKRSRRVG